jgi:hypothetical protein
MIKLCSLSLLASLTFGASALFTTAASACDSDCRCSDGQHHHQHHAMMESRDHMHHAMRHERSQHHRFAGGEHERQVFFMRLRDREGGPHERFDVWYGPHERRFAMMRDGEGCEHGMRFHHRHAWGMTRSDQGADFPPPPPPGMPEWREHRDHWYHDGDEEHRHHRDFDPYRDDWNSRGDGR